MKFRRTSLETCVNAAGVVVVIDVLRAFSTAAYAFAKGAKEIRLVSTIEEAFYWKEEIPGSLLMGEAEGLPIPGFDFGNSPSQFDSVRLDGKRLIQRTTSGTQGVVRSVNAEILLAASFCNVGATAKHLEALSPAEITFVLTGLRPGGWGDEDAACADFMEELLLGHNPDPSDYLRRVSESPPGRLFLDPKLKDYPFQDLEYCLMIDRFDFIMPIYREGEHLLMITTDL
jgi:2-phosphosulfolactate phosphatase